MAAPETAAGAAQPSLVDRPLAPEGGEVTASGTGTQLSLRAFVHSKRAMTGTAIIVLMGLFCFVGPLIYQTDQVTVNLAIANSPPGPGYPLGTDQYGIDVLGRLMVGGQSSLELGFAVGIATTLVGLLYGAVSGTAGGAVDAFLMRIVDTLLAVPTFILLIIVASMFSLSLPVIILILTALSWPCTARLIRGQVLALRSRELARAMGATGLGIFGPAYGAEHARHRRGHGDLCHRGLDLRALGARTAGAGRSGSDAGPIRSTASGSWPRPTRPPNPGTTGTCRFRCCGTGRRAASSATTSPT